jgi:hypothetical protein
MSTRGGAGRSLVSSIVIVCTTSSIAPSLLPVTMKHHAQARDEDEALLSAPAARPMTDDAAASTGVATLDAALDGLYWGDNVVWET